MDGVRFGQIRQAWIGNHYKFIKNFLLCQYYPFSINKPFLGYWGVVRFDVRGLETMDWGSIPPHSTRDGINSMLVSMKQDLPTHRPCASILIQRIANDGTEEILLVHKDREHDSWQIPQGGIEKGESAEQAARRELLEETNIDLTGTDLERSLHEYHYDYPRSFIEAEQPKYQGQHLIFFSALVPSDTVVQVDGRELDSYEWVQPSEIGKYLEREDYRIVVEKVIASHN